MVSFDHRDAGTPASSWRAAGRQRLGELDEQALPGAGGTLVVLAAHPDDETLGAGGLIQQCLARGAAVHVLVCSAGEASHPDSPTHRPEQLAAIRRREIADALRQLDATATTHGTLTWDVLGLPDGQLAGHTKAITDALELALAGPATVLASTYRGDGHIDHETLGRLAAETASRHGLALLEFPLWYWHWAEPDQDSRWRHWRRLQLSEAQQQAKAAAMAAHRSQVAPLSDQPGDEVLLSAAFSAHFGNGTEVLRYTPANTHSGSDAPQVFEQLYQQREDPWDYRTSGYERRKRQVLLASLARDSYRQALEVGCSIGELSAALAERSQRFLGLDASATAVSTARGRLAHLPHAQVREATVPQQWPTEQDGWDLVVISETGYFLAADELAELLTRCDRQMAPDGELVLCHWLHPIQGWTLDGETVHAMARELQGWHPVVEHREPDFLLEIYRRKGGTDE